MQHQHAYTQIDWLFGVEFECGGCGRNVMAAAMPRMYPLICGACLSIPGWWQEPAMRRAFDPIGELALARDCRIMRPHGPILMTPTECECRAAWIMATVRWEAKMLRGGIELC